MLSTIPSQALALTLALAFSAALASLFVGAAATFLSRRDGATWPSALQRGGVATGGTLTLVVLIAELLVALLKTS